MLVMGRICQLSLSSSVCVWPVLRIRIRDPVLFWPLDPMTIFWGRKFYNSLWIGPNFFLQLLKINIIYNFVIFVATKKGRTTNFFHPSLLLLFWIRDPGWTKIRIRDTRSGINIPDPQHCVWDLIKLEGRWERWGGNVTLYVWQWYRYKRHFSSE